jgi:hypothetical protein
MSDPWQSPKFTDADVDAEKTAVLAEIEAVSPHTLDFSPSLPHGKEDADVSLA